MRSFLLLCCSLLLLLGPADAGRSFSAYRGSGRRRRGSQNKTEAFPHEKAPRRKQHQRLRKVPKQESNTRVLTQDYHILESREIEERLQQLSRKYPDFCRLTTAQAEYNLPRAGGETDCPFDKSAPGCPNSILTIQDFVTHPQGSASSSRLPEVFWSGTLHGHERVGPTAVVEAADLLMKAAACIALPRLSLFKKSLHAKASENEWKHEVQKAKDCRQHFQDKFGITTQQLQWLARLVMTRRIVVVPTANALGYYRKVRYEGDVDVNRDFPYDHKVKPHHPDYNTKCMRSIAARALNEVFRQHMFQLSLTFHGGYEVIGYEWGAASYDHNLSSPDDMVQNRVAGAYSRYAGGFPGTPPYVYGDMNSLVYSVRGGMEDWAYAGSWDPGHVIPCKPDTFTDYPVERTMYNNSSLRALNMLVETSHNARPHEQLGSSWNILSSPGIANSSNEDGNGHVVRNIRLALLSVELVQPWLSIRKVNGLTLTDDLIPLLNIDKGTDFDCKAYKLVRIIPGQSRNNVTIKWTVGGALTVDDTQLWFAKWSDVETDLNCIDPPAANIVDKMRKGTPISHTSGHTVFASDDASPYNSKGLFSASINVSSFNAGDKIAVVVLARVDQEWATQPSPFEPARTPPQSHMANARTNPNWYHRSGDNIIQGRVSWFSIPITIEMGSVNQNETDSEWVTMELFSCMSSLPLDPIFSLQNCSGPPNPKQMDNNGLLVKYRFTTLTVLSFISVVCLTTRFMISRRIE